MNNKVTICILTCNSMPHIVSTINSILENTHYPNYEILINDSESTDGTKKYLSLLEKLYQHIKVIHTKKEGFIKALNTNIKEVKEGDILLTHDDVLFPKLYMKCWLIEMIKMSNLPNAGIITSMNGGGVSGSDYINGFPWVGTWCLFLLRETLNKVGLFDENFGIGFGDDIDFTYRVIKGGLNIYRANFAVDHHRMTEHVNEISTEFEETTKKRNAEYFRKKHKLGEFEEV